MKKIIAAVISIITFMALVLTGCASPATVPNAIETSAPAPVTPMITSQNIAPVPTMTASLDVTPTPNPFDQLAFNNVKLEKGPNGGAMGNNAYELINLDLTNNSNSIISGQISIDFKKNGLIVGKGAFFMNGGAMGGIDPPDEIKPGETTHIEENMAVSILSSSMGVDDFIYDDYEFDDDALNGKFVVINQNLDTYTSINESRELFKQLKVGSLYVKSGATMVDVTNNSDKLLTGIIGYASPDYKYQGGFLLPDYGIKPGETLSLQSLLPIQGGSIPDGVKFNYSGWAKVIYQDQVTPSGTAFTMSPPAAS